MALGASHLRARSLLALPAIVLLGTATACSTTSPSTSSPEPRSTPAGPPAGRQVAGGRGGSTYYVSPGGSDSNSGTSPGDPWRTIGRVNGARLHGGDTVLFQAGATFTDSSLQGNDGGRSGAPITYATYGAGDAAIPAIDIKRHSFLIFDHFTIHGEGESDYWGVAGSAASDITIENSTITHVKAGIGVFTGDRWRILHDTIDETGDSGILTQAGDNGGSPGTEWEIAHNVISDTGLYDFGYAEHGIYLKCRNSDVSDNTITGFKDSAISQRYGNDTLVGNRIAGGRAGSIGITFFPYDPAGHTSHWLENEVRGVATGLYAPLHDTGSPAPGGTTKESFLVERNVIGPLHGHGHLFIHLESQGRVTLKENRLLG